MELGNLSPVFGTVLVVVGCLCIGGGMFLLMLKGYSSPAGSWDAEMEEHAGERRGAERHRASLRRSSWVLAIVGLVVVLIGFLV